MRRVISVSLAFAVLLAAGATFADDAGAGEAGEPTDRYSINNSLVYDVKTGLLWASVQGRMTWTEAKASCKTGQRLPTVKELATLIDFYQTTGTAIDPQFFAGTPAEKFWSLTQFAGATSGDPSAWYVDFSVPPAAHYGPLTEMNGVRCVK